MLSSNPTSLNLSNQCCKFSVQLLKLSMYTYSYTIYNFPIYIVLYIYIHINIRSYCTNYSLTCFYLGSILGNFPYIYIQIYLILKCQYRFWMIFLIYIVNCLLTIVLTLKVWKFYLSKPTTLEYIKIICQNKSMCSSHAN